MKKWMFTIGFVALGAVGVSYVVKNSLDVSNSSRNIPTAQVQSHIASESTIYKSKTDQMQGSDTEASNENLETDNFVADLIAKLKSSYNDNIHLLHIQASLIQVKQFVLQRYPNGGEQLFAKIIAAAFPAYADNILSLLANLAIYQDWLLDNQADLLAMSEQIQQGTIWEKRREMFGSDAEKIWAHELSGMSEQQNAMQQVIKNLDQATDISMDEKLYQLRAAIDEQLDGSVQEAAIHGGVISKVFFTLGSVQSELGAMTANERQEKINDIRSQLGLTENQIEHLQTQDQERNKRWENGLAYMAERDQLIASVDEYTRTSALQELRERYFGRDALTIQREEESDFWRYKRPRLYGVN